MNGWQLTDIAVGVPLIGLALFSGLCTLAGQPLRFLLFGRRTGHPAHGWADLLGGLSMLVLLIGALLMRHHQLLGALIGLLGTLCNIPAALVRSRASRPARTGGAAD